MAASSIDASYNIRQVTYMTIRQLMLISVQMPEATYSIVAIGRRTGTAHDELWLTFATTH